MSGSGRVLVHKDEVFIADEIDPAVDAVGFVVVGPVATVAEALPPRRRAGRRHGHRRQYPQRARHPLA